MFFVCIFFAISFHPFVTKPILFLVSSKLTARLFANTGRDVQPVKRLSNGYVPRTFNALPPRFYSAGGAAPTGCEKLTMHLCN
jgi:hypothetical protein